MLYFYQFMFLCDISFIVVDWIVFFCFFEYGIENAVESSKKVVDNHLAFFRDMVWFCSSSFVKTCFFHIIFSPLARGCIEHLFLLTNTKIRFVKYLRNFEKEKKIAHFWVIPNIVTLPLLLFYLIHGLYHSVC